MRRAIFSDRRGAAAVEYALVLPMFLLAVIVIIETAWQMAVAAAVDHGARRGARWVSLGVAAPEGVSRAEQLARVAATAAGLPLRPEALSISATAFPNHAALATPAAGVAGLGGPDQVVRYTLEYRSSLLLPFAHQLLPAGWLTYRATVIVQNEPFPSN